MIRKLVGAAVALSMIATPALADGLIDNVNGITMDADGRVIHFSGVLIGADGKVKKLMQSGDKRPDKLDWLSNQKGRTLLPGFIDAHGHDRGPRRRAAAGYRHTGAARADRGRTDHRRCRRLRARSRAPWRLALCDGRYPLVRGHG